MRLSRTSIAIGSVVAAAAVFVGAHLLAPDHWLYAAEFRESRAAIARIESFRASRGALPETLADIGRSDDEQGPLYYASVDGHFKLWFAAPNHGFFGTYVYDSAQGAWRVGD
ncbi:MAG TPA: hypothetical protein VJV79_40355 [Polyangiaceae bacterium]|nr:hypothetical protein [Polyangiaceae bacterium]